MSGDVKLYETLKYKCLVFSERISDDLFLRMCGIEYCLPDYRFHAKDRPGYHLHVILKGKGVLCVNGDEQDLHFGQMFMTKPGEDTWYKADTEDPWVYCWMVFDGNIAQDSAESAGFSKGVNSQDCYVDQQDFYSLVERMLREVELTPSALYLHTGLLLEFIGKAVESNYKSERSQHRQHEYPTDTYVEYAAHFIEANYATVKINEVASYIGIHRSYLTSIFKKKMGISPQEYLMQCRIRMACKLLRETNNPIQEISRQVGYENPLTFSKTFKNYFGVSPRAYRLQTQKTS